MLKDRRVLHRRPIVVLTTLIVPITLLALPSRPYLYPIRMCQNYYRASSANAKLSQHTYHEVYGSAKNRDELPPASSYRDADWCIEFVPMLDGVPNGGKVS
jgi:hypothetical protein